MKLEAIFSEAKENWRDQEFILVDEYDKDDNLITILKYDTDKIAVFLHNVKDRSSLHHIMTYDEFEILDYGNFKRLRDELFYYAK